MDDTTDNVRHLKVVPRPAPPPLEKPNGQHCGLCHFWMQLASDGFCRRFPPALYFELINKQTGVGDGGLWRFPLMTKDGWCGEWRQRDHGEKEQP